VRPLPGPDANLRAADAPSAADLVARLDNAVRSFSGLRDVHNVDPLQRVTPTIQALGIFSRMTTILGPKSFIWVTHGFPIQANDLAGQSLDFSPTIRDSAQAAVESHVAYYVVDQSAQGAGADPLGLSRLTLKMYAELTGGRWYSSGRTDEAIAGAMADARGRYRLAYSPVAAAKSKLRVDAARKGVRLLARETYFNDDSAMTEQDAFAKESHSPFDATDIALRVAILPRTTALVHFDIRVEPGDVFLEHRGEGVHGSLAVMFAYYRNGVFENIVPGMGKEIDSVPNDGILISQDMPARDADRIRVMVYDRGMHGLGSVTVPLK